jgi:hypothetical protein
LHTLLVDRDEILVLVEKQTHALTLPKLEALMSKDHSLLISDRDIHANHIVCVDEDGFITDNQLLKALRLVSEHVDVGVSDIKLVLPLDQELSLIWVLLAQLENEETKFFLELVGEDVIIILLLIVDDFLDGINFIDL